MRMSAAMNRNVKIGIGALAILLCLLGVLWRLKPEMTAAVESPAVKSADSVSALPRARVLNALLTAPTPPSQGTLSIRGRVTNAAGGPVAGASVTATSGAGDDVLSGMTCACDNSCGEKLLSCGCGESAHQLVELVKDR